MWPGKDLGPHRATSFLRSYQQAMRLSRHFGRTLREAPADAVLTSHRLALRAGLAHPLAPGLWSYLPLGWRIMRRLQALLRNALEALGAQEVCLPSGSGGITEHIAALAAHEVQSYKDLPRTLYQFATHIREDIPTRGGLLGLREAHALDIFSLHTAADEDLPPSAVVQALAEALARCDLSILTVEAGEGTQAFALPHEQGEDRIVRCPSGDYAALLEAAAFTRTEARYGAPLPLQKVATPHCPTIADLCAFLNIPPQRTLKAVFYSAEGGKALVLAMLRGDLEVSEARLKALLGIKALEAASEEQIAAAGAQPGYASPMGLRVRQTGEADGVIVIADESLWLMSNFVTGANEAGYHVINANYPRDFAVTQVAAIAEPPEGAPCIRCGGSLQVESAIALGRCGRDDMLAETVGARYLDERGQAQPIGLGICRLELDRLLAAVLETHHDEHGILWPPALAPFEVHLVAIAKDPALLEVAERLYADLSAIGMAVLYDDRNLSAGVMFADADLIGIPLRVTVSERSLQAGGVEVKWRHAADRAILTLDGAAQAIFEMVRSSG